MCCICGRRPWCYFINNGDVASTIVHDVTISCCITSSEVGSILGGNGEVGVLDSVVVDSDTSNLGSCTGGGVLTGGLGVGGGAVQWCKASAACSKKLRVVYPAAKLGVFSDGGLVRIERISVAA